MRTRAADAGDAEALSLILRALAAAGKRRKPCDPAFARTHYIAHPSQIRCSVALDATGAVLGFQSLKRAAEGNPYGTPTGWGIIGTHLRPTHARQGVGGLLFADTLDAARGGGLQAIEACIAADNREAIAFYAAMGFMPYRKVDGADCRMRSLR